MSNLKIRVFKDGKSQPDTTITIPGGILKVASKLIPKKAAAALEDKGIEINELIKLANNPEIQGTIVEVEEHKKNERIIISLE
jgi:hypothetical protein